MSRAIISTASRHKAPEEASGHYYIVDIDSFQILQCSEIIEPPHREFDTNPRGGVRGGKGIFIREDIVILSNSSSVFIYDHNWVPLSIISHPSLGGIHDLCVVGDTLWITSSRNDLLFCFDFQGKILDYFDFRKMPHVFSEIKWKPKPFLSEKQVLSGKIDFRDPRTHDPNVSDASHINGVDQLPTGDLLVSLGLLINTNFSNLLLLKKWLLEKGLWKKWLALNRLISRTFSLKKHMHSDMVIQPARAFSAVVKISKNRQVEPCISFFGPTVPSHSVRILQDGTAVYLNTTNGEILHFSPETREIFSKEVIGKKFLRGVRQTKDGNLLVGDNQLLYRYDHIQKQIITTMKISDDPHEAIYDIFIMPDDLGLPPISFPDHHKKYQLPIKYEG